MRNRQVLEIPQNVKRRLKQKYPCCICGTNEDLEIHHLDKFPKNGIIRLNVVCKRHHRAITYLETWFPDFYLKVVVPYLEKKSISVSLNEIMPSLLKFMKSRKVGCYGEGKNSKVVDIF